MSNLISDDKINEIRQASDIVDVISSYLPLTAKGKNYFGVCPFHPDHSPSMSVSRDKQIFRCFSCGASGNVIKFVMDYENITFVESLKMLADRSGIDLNVGTFIKKNDSNLYKLFEISQKVYQNNLNTKEAIEANKYLEQRNISKEIIDEFKIGLSIKSNKLLSNVFKENNISEKDMILSGLINQKDFETNDVFYNRIMFPLFDLTGRVVSYSGRTFTNENPKYLTTKENEIFKKGKLLYNYHKAKEETRKLNSVIIMEGFMDVIAAYKIGIKNVVATMGTAFTKDQALLVKKLSNNVILCFDGDEAGLKATNTAIIELNELGINPKVVILEDDLDPDEYIKKHGNQFNNKVENAINSMDFKIKYFKKDIDITNSIEYSKYINKVLNELSSIDDDILVELTLKKLADESNIDINMLRSKIKKEEKKEETEFFETKTDIHGNKYEKATKYLLYYMLQNKEVVTMFENQKIYIDNVDYRNLIRELSAIYKKNVELADILNYFIEDDKKTNLINEILSLNLPDKYKEEEISDYIRIIILYNMKKQRNKIKEQLKNETNDEIKANLIVKITELKKEEQNILKEV